MVDLLRAEGIEELTGAPTLGLSLLGEQLPVAAKAGEFQLCSTAIWLMRRLGRGRERSRCPGFSGFFYSLLKRCYDNILIVWPWRSSKYEAACLHLCSGSWEAEICLARILLRYCHLRHHSSMGRQIPHADYAETLLLPPGADDASGSGCSVKYTLLATLGWP